MYKSVLTKAGRLFSGDYYMNSNPEASDSQSTIKSRVRKILFVIAHVILITILLLLISSIYKIILNLILLFILERTIDDLYDTSKYFREIFTHTYSIVLLIAFYLLYKLKKDDFPLTKFHGIIFIKAAAICSFGYLFIEFFHVLYAMENGYFNLNRHLTLESFCFGVLMVTISAAWEEVYFRGFIMNTMKLVTNNSYVTILISAIFFTIAHVGQKNLIALICVFIGGIVYGYLYAKYNSISVCIAFHAVHNITISAFIYSSDSSIAVFDFVHIVPYKILPIYIIVVDLLCLYLLNRCIFPKQNCSIEKNVHWIW